jgi:hypothetical protein
MLSNTSLARLLWPGRDLFPLKGWRSKLWLWNLQRKLKPVLNERGRLFDDADRATDKQLTPTFEWTCSACPLQAEGTLANGKHWYFRARHDHYYFGVAGSVEDAVFKDTSDWGKEYGPYPDASWMNPCDAVQLIHGCIEEYTEWKKQD